MRTASRTFVNELDNEIKMSVTIDQIGSTTVSATGPTSEVDHTFTKQEAIVLRDLLSRALELFERAYT